MKKIFLTALLFQVVLFTAKAQVDLSAHKDRFCEELRAILNSVSAKEMGKLVDYKKPQGITKSWYEGKAALTGCEDFSGQIMWGYVTYQGKLSGSEGKEGKKLYKALVKVIDGCLSGYKKKKAEYADNGTDFIHKDNEKLQIRVRYYGDDQPVEISFIHS